MPETVEFDWKIIATLADWYEIHTQNIFNIQETILDIWRLREEVKNLTETIEILTKQKNSLSLSDN